ncbi:hypothetical protein G3T14_20555, partial [Methylobacterium sp. BTF04]|nr:hypothetical protein [Methylobacterium sp. BTF04]
MHEIRMATIVDADSIAEVHVNSWKESYLDLLPKRSIETFSVKDRAEMWVKILEQSNISFSRVYIAELDKKVIGFAHASKQVIAQVLGRGGWTWAAGRR